MAATVISAELVRVDDPLNFTERAAIARFCAKEGTDPAAIKRTALCKADVDIEAWRDAGISHLIVGVGHPFDLAPLERLLTAR